MTITRMSLAQILQKEFKNPSIRKKCRDSSQRFLDSDDNGMSTRVFNDFPRLLPIQEFNELLDEFFNIFKEIKSIHFGHDSIHLEDEKDIQALKVWGRDIARRACAAILNGYGHIQWSLLELLGWEEHAHSYSTHHIINIVSSYVATIIEQIMSTKPELIKLNPIAYTAVCKYINEQYRLWAIKAINSEKQDVCRTQAIQFAAWIIERDDLFNSQDLVVLQRLLKAEFMWDTDTILMRNEKLGFWLEILFQTSINKKPKIFFAMWDIFISIFNSKQDANYLEVHQLKQYHFCQSNIPLLEKEKKRPKYRPRSVYLEQKEDLSQLMMTELRERVASRNQHYLAQEDQRASTTFLLRKLTEGDLEFAYSIEDRFKKKKSMADEKADEEKKRENVTTTKVEDDFVLVDKPQEFPLQEVEDDFLLVDKPEEADDSSAGLFQYTVGLLTAGAMGLFLYAKNSFIKNEEILDSKSEDKTPNAHSSIELTSSPVINTFCPPS